jgi:hypothetical protein
MTSVIGSVLVPVAYAVAGPAADMVGVRAVLAGCAALVLAGCAVTVCVQEVRHLGISPNVATEKGSIARERLNVAGSSGDCRGRRGVVAGGN